MHLHPHLHTQDNQYHTLDTTPLPFPSLTAPPLQLVDASGTQSVDFPPPLSLVVRVDGGGGLPAMHEKLHSTALAASGVTHRGRPSRYFCHGRC